ncbi:MAG: nucleotidyltransferase domain-containing protein [Halodesulfurarchaeum sp.]
MAAHEDRGVDPDEIRTVLESHPVQLGVLFGSQARGTSASHSDIDVAVAFDPKLSETQRSRARIDHRRRPHPDAGYRRCRCR